MNKTEFRILWSDYNSGRFESISINTETETRDEGIRKWFILTREQNDDSGYNFRQRWTVPLEDMLRGFGRTMQNSPTILKANTWKTRVPSATSRPSAIPKE